MQASWQQGSEDDKFVHQVICNHSCVSQLIDALGEIKNWVIHAAWPEADVAMTYKQSATHDRLSCLKQTSTVVKYSNANQFLTLQLYYPSSARMCAAL